MTTKHIAQQVVILLREGKFEAIYNQFFDAEKIRHIEPQSEYFSDLTGLRKRCRYVC